MSQTAIEPIATALGVLVPERMLRRSDLARIFGVSISGIQLWERAGRLPKPVRMGNRLFWRPEQIQAVLDAGGSPDTKPADAGDRGAA